MGRQANLRNITIVLNKPRYPENIGAAARAACNMGVENLAVVQPENYDVERVLRLATHAAKPVVAHIDRFDDLKTALAPYHFVVGTTARLGGERSSVLTPDSVARDLILLSEENRVALLFGPEDRGLTNEELRLCHRLVHIPTSHFSSLNLGQAVMVLCYEVFKATLPDSKPFKPRLASRHELDGMYEQVKDILVRIDYIQPDNPDYWMNKLRHFFSRLQLRAAEVSIIRGICRQINWYAGKCHKDGVNGAPAPEVHRGQSEKRR
ncbi:MAG: RNA methyltransferase [Desulfobacteraceae bacterium]